jgi:large subunit ribosomal protein L33
MPRDIITLQCTETKLRLYTTTKNKKKTTEKLELKKYNPVVRRHTVFRETK